MKIAVSFAGKRGYSKGREGSGEKLDLEITFNHLKRHIIDKYNTDIFIHTWDEAEVEYMKKTFKPVSIQSEPQKFFGLDIKKMSLNEINDEFGLGAEFRTFSKMYGFFKSLDLVFDYQAKNGFKYDYIICLRLDTLFLKNINLKKLEKEKVYVQKKVYSNTTVNLNFKNNYHHSSYILILNSDHVKKLNYKEIYKFNFNTDEKNYFNSFRPAYTYMQLEKSIFFNNKVSTSLPLWLTNITRRVYSNNEFTFVNGIKTEDRNLLKEDLAYNNLLYKVNYKKETKLKYLDLLKYFPLILKRQFYDLQINFYVFRCKFKNHLKNKLPKIVLSLIANIKKNLGRF
jgi:hypothetical protein